MGGRRLNETLFCLHLQGLQPLPARPLGGPALRQEPALPRRKHSSERLFWAQGPCISVRDAKSQGPKFTFWTRLFLAV